MDSVLAVDDLSIMPVKVLMTVATAIEIGFFVDFFADFFIMASGNINR